MGKRIVFTGGSGKIGRHVIPYLLKRGHQVLNLDLTPLDVPGVDTVITDLADAGETYNALTLHFGFSEYFGGKGRRPVDAVVHFAALPRIFLRPDNAMFAANVQSTYNVIEAATKLGVRKIVTASSETVYGVCFAEGERDFTSFPVDEDYDADPTDSYGLSKLLGERIARSFASRTGADIYALRIGGVVEPHDYTRFPEFLADPSKRRRDAWTYMDARDLGQIVHLCIEKDSLGFQIFNAVNDNIVSELPTAEFLKKHAPNIPVTRAMDVFEGPISNRKLRDVLGFRQEHDWRTQ
ncbi:NAD(P)-dependent oxidoreductase [Mesorhizobium sp. M2C.T.Ca.TU.002.02.1.1]|uniref:NAD-dependent epimerase/dehydratase family protein n=1 Tax=Mesorhizobium sp. M2C.T.Ca.TU.002.02.1.1 TaxID=2496788 RepID=UPI000FCC4D0F|nr:NAD(P)-dependent oxidoreductase [Mesorhizobium sp. M2C.T.Ca.TU.002.02.1.1]RUU60989.1 NAD(P)-dependent oxidoreductase [Mesorhizobium sp. M2C.T.Ca.TU.002.02.1.1]RUU71097.1 NAD(P)-dependent oxidoreductase [Mesorhizobium sp. M2C.T.Ca.TU.009.01.2.1]